MSYKERASSMGFVDNVLSRFQKTDVLDIIPENPTIYHPERVAELTRQALVREQQERRGMDRKVRAAILSQTLDDVWQMLPRLGKRNTKLQTTLSGAVAFSGVANALAPQQAIVIQATGEQQAKFGGKSDQFVTIDPIRPDLRKEIDHVIEAPVESVIPTADFVQVSDQGVQKEILDLMQSGKLTKEKFLEFLDKNHLGGNLAKTLSIYENIVLKNPNLNIAFNVSKTTDDVLNIVLCMRDPKTGMLFLANPLKSGEVMGLDSDGTLQSIQVAKDSNNTSQAYLTSFVPGPSGDEVLYPYQTVILSNQGIPAPYSIGQGETTGNASLIVGKNEIAIQSGMPVSILAGTDDGYFWVKASGQLGYMLKTNVSNATRLPINFMPMMNPNVKNAPKVTPEPSNNQAAVYVSYDLAKMASKPELSPELVALINARELSGAARVSIDKLTDPTVVAKAKDKSSGIYAPRENGPDRYWKIDAEGKILLWTPNMTWDGEHNSPWLVETDRLVLPNSNTIIIMELDPTSARDSWYPEMHFTPDALSKIDSWIVKNKMTIQGKKVYVRWIDSFNLQNYINLKGVAPVKSWVTFRGPNGDESSYAMGADLGEKEIVLRLFVHGDRGAHVQLPKLDNELYSAMLLRGLTWVGITKAKDPMLDMTTSASVLANQVLPTFSLTQGVDKASYIIDW